MCVFGSWDLHISGNSSVFWGFFFVYTDRMYFVFLLPTLMWRGRTAVFSELEQCVCMGTYVYAWACMCHMCVCVVAREETGAACAYRRVRID